MQPLQWWAESAPPGGDRVKVSESLGATSVAPVAPVDTSLSLSCKLIRDLKVDFTKPNNIPAWNRIQLSYRYQGVISCHWQLDSQTDSHMQSIDRLRRALILMQLFLQIGHVGRHHWWARGYKEYPVCMELFVQVLSRNESLLLHLANHSIWTLPGLLFGHQLCMSGLSGKQCKLRPLK